MPIEIFCCYAREDQPMLEEMKKHLTPLQRQGLITLWSDTDLNAGQEWEKVLHQHLNTAQIILLLISPDFMASDYCYSIEMRRALERHKNGEVQVIPIMLRPVDWEGAPFVHLQCLPHDARAVTEWDNQDKAFFDVTKGIKEAVAKRETQTFSRQTLHQSTSNAFASPLPPRRNFHRLALVASFLLTIIVAFLMVVNFSHAFNDTSVHKNTSVPTSVQVSIFSPGGTLFLNDPLRDNSKGYGWDETEGHCTFRGGAYHVTTSNPNNYECNTNSPRADYSNFAYQVSMKIDQGTKGGICFRFTVNDQTGYCFFLDLNGQFILEKVNFNTPREDVLVTGKSSNFVTGLGKTNQIAVRAQGSTIDLYINGHFIRSATDSNFSHGQIGVFLVYPGFFTEAEFTDAKIWVY